MTLKVHREGAPDFTIPNGRYVAYDMAGFNKLKELLRGYPCGITELKVDKDVASVVIARGVQVISPNTGELNDPIKVIDTKGKVDVNIGQRYEHTSRILVEVLLSYGAHAKLISQGQTFELTHGKK